MIFFISVVTIYSLFFLSGCSATTSDITPKYISQDVSKYTKSLDTNISLSLSQYKKNYFAPWYMKKSDKTLAEVSWALTRYADKKNYGSNLCLLEKDFLLKMRENINLKNYGSVNKIAITLGELDIRALPTNKPLFANPKEAGEGFPFDYLQNSTIHQNKPIFVTHYSKDREWVHIESSFTYGWVKRKDIKFISTQQRDFLVEHSNGFVQKEDVAFYDKTHNYLGRTKFGMLLPIVGENEKSYDIAVVDGIEKDFIITKIDKEVVHKNPLSFNKKNVIKIVTGLEKSKYGWGGMSGERDCSSTLRDFYAPFGFWLPRNSSLQAKVGKQFSLDGLSDSEKEQQIKRDAIPFRTLLYMHGHILLYSGIVDGKIIVFQNMWGIRTKKDGISGRYIIGRALFTSLDFGITLKNYDKNSKLISKIKSFNILF